MPGSESANRIDIAMAIVVEDKPAVIAALCYMVRKIEPDYARQTSHACHLCVGLFDTRNQVRH
jgi:hypothetical protein